MIKAQISDAELSDGVKPIYRRTPFCIDGKLFAKQKPGILGSRYLLGKVLLCLCCVQPAYAGGFFDSIAKDILNGVVSNEPKSVDSNQPQHTGNASNNKCSEGNGLSVGDIVSTKLKQKVLDRYISSSINISPFEISENKVAEDGADITSEKIILKLSDATKFTGSHLEGNFSGLKDVYVEGFPRSRLLEYYQGLSRAQVEQSDIPFEFKVTRLFKSFGQCVLTATFEKFPPESEQAFNSRATLKAERIAKENARINSLANEYSKTTKIPVDLLSAPITFSVGGEQNLRLVEYLDICKNKSNIKTTFEFSDNELIVRQKFVDKINKKDVRVDYLFSGQMIEYKNGASKKVALVKRLVVGGIDSNAYEAPQVFFALLQSISNM